MSNSSPGLMNRHQMRQCWEFSPRNILDEFEMVAGKSIATPLELQKALTGSDRLGSVDFINKDIQRVSEVMVNNVKYAFKDVYCRYFTL